MHVLQEIRLVEIAGPIMGFVADRNLLAAPPTVVRGPAFHYFSEKFDVAAHLKALTTLFSAIFRLVIRSIDVIQKLVD